VRGASALQGLLTEMPSKPVRAFIVWEPVLATDVGPPTTSVLSRVSDSRAEQWWDRDRLLSDRVLTGAREGLPAFAVFSGDQELVWDLVALYPPGTKWRNAIPAPAYCGNPLADSARIVVMNTGKDSRNAWIVVSPL
jgi:hypothetical protein